MFYALSEAKFTNRDSCYPIEQAGNATEGFNDWLDSVSAPDDDAGEVEATPYGLSNTTGEPGMDFGSSDDVVPSGDVPSSATLRFVSVSVLGAYAVSAIASL